MRHALLHVRPRLLPAPVYKRVHVSHQPTACRTLAKFMNSIWCAGDEGAKSQKLCITSEVGNNTPICSSKSRHTTQAALEAVC
jgi:hypothetical protein